MTGMRAVHSMQAIWAFALVLCLVSAIGHAAPRGSAVGVATDRLIVKLRAQSDERHHRPMTDTRRRSLSTHAGESLEHHRTMSGGAHVMRLARRKSLNEVEAIAAKLRTHPDVLYAVPDRLVFPQLTPNDPQFVYQWNLGASPGINAPAAWDITGTASIVVAVIDTGILPHADLAGRTVPGYDFVSDVNRANDGNGRDNDPTDPGDWVTSDEAATVGGPFYGCPVQDSSWHGTVLAGIIGAAGNNATGIAGVNWNSRILPVRAIGKCGGYTSDIADAIRWAAGLPVTNINDQQQPAQLVNPNPAKVINLSLATAGACDAVFQSAINEVTTLTGATVVVAAGNQGQDAANYTPASCNNVITVTAVDRNGGLPSYANTGPAVALAAPGGLGSGSDGVISTGDSGGPCGTASDAVHQCAAHDNAYVAGDGTSLAAAHVSGIASLMLAVNPKLKYEHVRDILKGSVSGFPAISDAAGCSVLSCGAGIANAYLAVSAAIGYSAVTPQIAGGGDHVIALSQYGTVWAWGGNSAWQLGDINSVTLPQPDSPPADQHTPVQVLAVGVNGLLDVLRDVAAVAAGREKSFAALADGMVVAWGQFILPHKIPGPNGVFLNGIVALVTGNLESQTLALRSDGTVWVVDVTGLAVPVAVNDTGGGNLNGVIAVAAGGGHNLALKSDGTVWAWGDNTYGQLGDGTNSFRQFPVQVAGFSGNANLSKVIAIAAGDTHSLALQSDGTLWVWGDNFYGQLGDGTSGFSTDGMTTKSRSTPFRLADEISFLPQRGFIKIAAGASHTMALGVDGSLWAWGRNFNGELGDATNLDRNTPQPVVGKNGPGSVMDGITNITAGDSFSLAYGDNHDVYSWGANRAGQLGDNTTADRNYPVKVSGPYGSGGNFNLGAPGVLNFSSQLGQHRGGLAVSNPIVLGPIGNGVAISITGGEYLVNGGVFTSNPGLVNAGDTVVVRLTTSTNYEWTSVATLNVGGVIKQFSVTTNKADFTPNAFGFVTQAHAALSTEYISNTITVGGTNAPATISITGGLYSINGGPYTGVAGEVNSGDTVTVSQISSANDDTLTAAVLTIGGVSAEFDVITSVGPAFFAMPQITPLGVSGFIVPDLPATVVALDSHGDVWSWGGALGVGTTPAIVSGLSGIKAIATSGVAALRSEASGNVWTWGRNNAGQLGDGSNADRSYPMRVRGPNGSGYLAGITAVSGSANGTSLLALKADGTVWAWGDNSSGQLGDGTTLPRRTPVQVLGAGGTGYLTGIKAIAGNSSNIISRGSFLALKDDGTVWAWGDNSQGQLGDGTNTQRVYPVQVLGAGGTGTFLTGVYAISGGDGHSLAMKLDGTVWEWGWTQSNNAVVPIQVNDGGATIAISGGFDHSLELRRDAAVRAWGGNQFGQLGDGSFSSASAPKLINPRIVNGPKVVELSAGGGYSIARWSDGTLSAWGDNTYGQLGDGTATSKATAVQVLGSQGGAFNVGQGNPNTFPPVFSALPGTQYTSDVFVMAAMGTNVAISIANGEYSLNGGAFTSAPGHASDGDLVALRLWSSPNLGVTTSATFTMGTTNRNFNVTTVSAPSTTPNAFRFAIKSDMATGAAAVSEPIQVSGINFATSISVTGGQYSINGGAFTSSSGMVGPGDSVRVQVAASANFNTVSSATLTIGGVSSVFQAVTAPSATFTTPSQIDGGLHHTVVLKSDGSVWAWGADTAGQFNAVPTDTGLYGVKAVAAGLSASFALRPDGAVWAWGDNVDGQLGDGSNGHKDPRLIPGLSGVVAIAAGGYHTLGLKDDGTLWGWGANDHGALGNNTTSKSAVPVQASVPPGVMAIATGLEHSLALVSDETGITGTVWTWGWNAFGQLGDGTNDDKLKPTQVPGLTGVIAIAAGAYHSLALKADGTIWAWGYNVNGELGNNGSANALIPVQVVDAGGLGFNAKVANSQLAAIKIAAGSNHSFALKSDGTVWAWGSNLHGQLGDGSTTNRAVPVAVVGLDGVAGVVGGGAAHSTAVMADGTLRVWGWNAFQTLGDGTNTDRLVPEEVVGPEGNFFALPKTASTPDPFHFVSRFGAALNAPVVSSEVTVSGTSAPSSVAIASVPPGAQYSVNGGAYTAAPATVNLGDVLTIRMNASSSYAATSTATLAISGVTGSYSVVTQRDPAAQVVAQGIAAGYHHTLVMRSDGMVWGFGYNGYGQLANGTTLSRSAPQFLSHLTNVVQIAAGHFHTLALKADGTLVASGWNGAGQLGDGSANASRLLPVPVVGSGGLGLLSNIVAIAAGHAHSLAVDKSGNVWAWGLNSDGQLGNGTVTPSYTPVRVTGLSKVVAVAAGNNHSVALTSDGTLWSWGNNDYGQLGTGTVSGRRVPVQIALGQVAKIAAGYAYTLALRNDGSVWAWGQNTFGQLGLGDNIGVSLPALVPGLEARVTAIAAGQFHSLAVKAGQLYAWGKNSNGQIGDGTSNNPIRPLAVSALGGTNIVSVAGGGAYSAALSDAGVLYSFGDNTFGQVGNRSGNYSPQRARMNILRGDVDISDFTVAAYSALALQSTAGSNAVNLDKLGPMVFSTTQPLKTPSAQQTVQFVNDSLESNIPNVVFAAAGPFSVVSHNCPGIVPPQGNCQVKLTFTPIQPGAQTGELQAKWIDSGSQMLLAFPLQGTGAPLATTATVAANVIATTVGANVTLTATIFGGSNPSGMVQFKVNGVNIGAPVTVTAGQAQLTINSLVVGSQTITAVYSGDSNNAGSTAPGLTETVSPAVTSVGVASSAGSPRFGQSVTLTATISGGVNPTGTVQFKDGGINLGVPVAVVGGTAVLSTTALIVGSHSIAATYAGDANNLGSTSAPLTQVVNANGGGGPAVPTMPEWAVLLLGSLLIFIARRGLIRS